jgi:hypothetical protein
MQTTGTSVRPIKPSPGGTLPALQSPIRTIVAQTDGQGTIRPSNGNSQTSSDEIIVDAEVDGTRYLFALIGALPQADCISGFVQSSRARNSAYGRKRLPKRDYRGCFRNQSMDRFHTLATNIRQTTRLFASCDGSSIDQYRLDRLPPLDRFAITAELRLAREAV